MQDTVQSTTYRGFEITLAAPGMACPFFVHKLRRPCRDLAHGQEIVDAHLERAAQPRQPGELHVVAVLPGERMLSASACRNRSEQARGQRRVSGKFATEVSA
ncbi:hypothetical protein [Deinococcus wulumuqiensis]|uniref:Uncharacterized protein n=1 Tax=Deinococcus wulumuqiensis TaxID=980427 RepID=A0AAV4K7G4_9DEIO|nr:hypothetical protein [Deinococcus wulumuqiensis]QII20148.1 hypothetical protein G6R31_04730 [Deinococcus wulumuqiensis R12]GGI75742.1 hypothetical protein GCM10010914_07400 [Deinococcus wulumuqiensis]GGP28756.1 hypothetical protein GCM10008021_04070 [Deinococcus wulumuqiensis]